MMYFKNRSAEKELMDNTLLEDNVLLDALIEIDKVNRLLGGHKITLKAIDKEIVRDSTQTYTILDVGCGAGFMLRKLAEHCKKNKYNVNLMGIDINPKSIAIAKQLSLEYPEIVYKTANILDCKPDNIKVDFLINTLTMHHFDAKSITLLLKHFITLTTKKIIINDLQRSKLAYVLFWSFSRSFLKSNITKVDGLISIKRSFLKRDIMQYSKAACVTSKVIWKWAFRYLWTINCSN